MGVQSNYGYSASTIYASLLIYLHANGATHFSHPIGLALGEWLLVTLIYDGALNFQLSLKKGPTVAIASAAAIAPKKVLFS